MERCGDFVQILGLDMSIKILMCLEDPSDLVRASAVSTCWRKFVIGNGLCKHLCLRRYPEIASAANIIEVENRIVQAACEHENPRDWSRLERDQRVFGFLWKGLSMCMRKDCLSVAIQASSTDNYPEESIVNTLQASDRVGQRASYWSSKGQSDPTLAETLTYKLISNLCLISEIHVQPFQAYFQFGFPIYSAKSVRFRVGHPKLQVDVEILLAQGSYCDNIIWTYTSPAFPMLQENSMQKFKLPEPVLCIGGILQVELLGRVQRQEMDGLYYICVSHIQIVGRPLLAAYDVEILDESGKCNLKYKPEEERLCQAHSGESSSSGYHSVRGWEQMILNTLLGTEAVVVDDDSDVYDV